MDGRIQEPIIKYLKEDLIARNFCEEVVKCIVEMFKIVDGAVLFPVNDGTAALIITAGMEYGHEKLLISFDFVPLKSDKCYMLDTVVTKIALKTGVSAVK